ncbi:UDP-Glycosyltransferase superfamily protein [Striga asiatica]|uniref:Glycosyltransferase n=1 Tax=Striga asiatica TaxID=4170 RepID=A0A5A7PW23_STRAF|nr:UDP-Glycosyltransferase superfamily protein [Striga asiatica]
MDSKPEQLHFILIPLMSQSHIIPLTDFAKILALRGACVSIITTPLNAARYDGVAQHAAAHNLKIHMIPIEFPGRAVGLPDGCENMDGLNSLDMSREFFRACQMLQGPLESIIQGLSSKPSCIVSTNAIPWTQKVADKFKIPRYNFETVSCFTLLCSRRIEGSAVPERGSFPVPNIPHDIELTAAQLPMGQKEGPNGMQDVLDEIKWARDSARGTLVNTFHELEPWYFENYRALVGNLWCVGPVSLCNVGVDEKSTRGDRAGYGPGPDCLAWLEAMGPRSVVYACFGSLCRIRAEQTKEIGLGLERSGLSEEVERWLGEKGGFEERVRGRGLVVRGWAPQVLILSHPSVGAFLTHCGWNSTLEGVCAGVPMVTWPMFAEQFYNEKFVVGVLGVGVRVGVETGGEWVGWDRVRSAVEEVMDGGEEGVGRPGGWRGMRLGKGARLV